MTHYSFLPVFYFLKYIASYFVFISLIHKSQEDTSSQNLHELLERTVQIMNFKQLPQYLYKELRFIR